jgi:hypothetical protein
MFPKDPCVEGLASSSGTTGRWWNLVEYRPSRRKLSHWGHTVEENIGILAPLFHILLYDCHEVTNSLPPHAPTIMEWTTTGPSYHGLKPLKLLAKINLSVGRGCSCL